MPAATVIGAGVAVSQDIVRGQNQTFQNYKTDIDSGKIKGVQVHVTPNTSGSNYPAATIKYTAIPKKN